ncbi:hypothetical protein C9374_004170 [Naegleria lovaniensis]|uniref:Uncharacterized protein n=1 Tax=Naegleria lovaniensis TaxID=51637 RepID=A0AA88GQU9_NAELO|nr:uncharacterized protein C9374_004170 [Naegleria lovaniensis]KAG2383499.1 hypothetical protein C9374_004170 [Naegleria lovaniensis]
MDPKAHLNNTRAVVHLTKTKSIIKMITNNEIYVHKRSKSAMTVKVTAGLVMGLIVLDPASIDEIRKKNSIRYKIVKHVLAEATTAENMNKKITEKSLDVDHLKLLYYIISEQIVKLISPTCLDSLTNAMESYSSHSCTIIRVDRKFYFGNCGELVDVIVDVFGFSEVKAKVNDEEIPFKRKLSQVIFTFQLPAEQNTVSSKKFNISFLSHTFNFEVFLIAANLERCFDNFMNVELFCDNGMRRDHAESLFNCIPSWKIDTGSTFHCYVKEYLQVAKNWTQNEADYLLDFLKFLLTTNSFFALLAFPYPKDYPTNSYTYLYCMKLLIDLFFVFNAKMKCKNPVMNFCLIDRINR